MKHEEIAALAADHAMYGVELRGKSPGDHISPEVPVLERKRIKNRYQSFGVKIIGVTGYSRFRAIDKHRKKLLLEEIFRYGELCADLEAVYLRCYAGELDRKEMDAEGLKQAAELLEEAALLLSPYPVTLCVELHDSVSTGTQAAQLLKSVTGKKNLGIIWNTTQPWKAGEAPEDTCRMLGDKIIATHLCDVLPQKEGHFCQVFPGQGNAPLWKQLLCLKQIQFSGYHVINWERSFDGTLAPIGEALDTYRNYICTVINSVNPQ